MKPVATPEAKQKARTQVRAWEAANLKPARD